MAVGNCREDRDHDLFEIQKLDNRIILEEVRSKRDNLIITHIP